MPKILGDKAVGQLRRDHAKLKTINPGFAPPRRRRAFSIATPWAVLTETLGPSTGLNDPKTATATRQEWSDDASDYVDAEEIEVVLRVKNKTFDSATTLKVFHDGVEWVPFISDC